MVCIIIASDLLLVSRWVVARKLRLMAEMEHG